MMNLPFLPLLYNTQRCVPLTGRSGARAVLRTSPALFAPVPLRSGDLSNWVYENRHIFPPRRHVLVWSPGGPHRRGLPISYRRRDRYGGEKTVCTGPGGSGPGTPRSGRPDLPGSALDDQRTIKNGLLWRPFFIGILSLRASSQTGAAIRFLNFSEYGFPRQ